MADQRPTSARRYSAVDSYLNRSARFTRLGNYDCPGVLDIGGVRLRPAVVGEMLTVAIDTEEAGRHLTQGGGGVVRVEVSLDRIVVYDSAAGDVWIRLLQSATEREEPFILAAAERAGIVWICRHPCAELPSEECGWRNLQLAVSCGSCGGARPEALILTG
jgi:hypothetical protein